MQAPSMESLLKKDIGISEMQTRYMMECAIQCLQSQDHNSGVTLKVSTDAGFENFNLTWPTIKFDKFEVVGTVEYGALFIGLLLSQKFTEYDYCVQALKQTGSDFWLFKGDPFAEKRPQNIINKTSAMLEVSGIFRGNNENSLHHRFSSKLAQIEKSGYSSLSYISITNFDQPETIFKSTELKEDLTILVPHVKLDEINTELIRHLAKYPNKMYEMESYKFETLVAELLRDMGYDVFLTPKTVDGGRDIIAVLKSPTGAKLLTLVECKKNRKDRPVGIDTIRQFLWTLRDQDKANIGLIVTTSHFSEKARAIEKDNKWLLSLNDYEKMKTWLTNYGNFKQESNHEGLWLRYNPLK
jgi:hypothetical protein